MRGVLSLETHIDSAGHLAPPLPVERYMCKINMFSQTLLWRSQTRIERQRGSEIYCMERERERDELWLKLLPRTPPIRSSLGAGV